MRILFIALFFLIPILHTFSQDELSTPSDEEDYRRWEENLIFGIERVVLSTIDVLIEEGVDQLADKIADLFLSQQTSIRMKSLDYFESLERDDLIPHILEELEFYQDIANSQFTARIVQHLERRAYPIDTKLWVLIEEMLQEESREVRRRLISYVGAQKYKIAVPILQALYEEADLYLRESILQALGHIADESSKDFIFALARNAEISTSLRIHVIKAAAAYGDSQAFEIIAEAYALNELFIKLTVLKSLANFESGTQELYLKALRDSSWQVRLAALKGIADAPFSEALPALEYMFRNDPEEKVKQQTLATIAALSVDKGWDVLYEILTDSSRSDSYRQQAAIFLIQNNFTLSRTVIEEVIAEQWDKKDSRLLVTISKALSEQSISGAADLYEKMLGHRNVTIQIYAVRGISKNKITALRPQLRLIAEDPVGNEVLRKNANEALKEF